LENLHHLSGGDEKFVRQMLISFNDTTGKELEEMKIALKSGQLQNVSDIAHKMLPPSRHIGAKDLCNLLKRIEESIRNKEEHKLIEPLITELICEFDTVSLLIKNRIAEIN
jgi:HPt (histidine-containing phosphotransfer) domain-containing protein